MLPTLLQVLLLTLLNVFGVTDGYVPLSCCTAEQPPGQCLVLSSCCPARPGAARSRAAEAAPYGGKLVTSTGLLRFL